MTASSSTSKNHWPLLGATFVLAVSGLVYELLAGTVSSYLLGASVTQFSFVIGLFMSAMGIGAWFSRHVDDPKAGFVIAQIALGLIGGMSALLLFWAYAIIGNYNAFLFLICILAGSLIGIEIPLVTRILENESALRINISNILTADYIGALAAALAFPLILVPQLGLVQTGLVFGLLNLAVAGFAIRLFQNSRLWRYWLPATAILLAALTASSRLTTWIETRLFDAEIIYAANTPYQRLVLTKTGERMQLFLNGNLQFDTLDEYRYHEALVHPLMTLSPHIETVLILGGGDGMALREVLRYDEVKRAILVDLDPEMTSLFRDKPELAALNSESLRDPRTEIVNADAWQFVEQTQELFDAVIIDLPDPHSLTISKLYSIEFYKKLSQRMARHALLVTQSTSPVFARQAFWSIHATLEAAHAPGTLGQSFGVWPYHSYVPSFGDWGFNLAGGQIPIQPRRKLPEGLRFMDPEFLERAQHFPEDSSKVDAAVNSIMDHALTGYYEAGWRQWFGE